MLIEAPEAGLERDSVVLLNQVRSIDRQRIVRRLGRVTAETMRHVERGLAISLGLVEI